MITISCPGDLSSWFRQPSYVHYDYNFVPRGCRLRDSGSVDFETLCEYNLPFISLLKMQEANAQLRSGEFGAVSCAEHLFVVFYRYVDLIIIIIIIIIIIMRFIYISQHYIRFYALWQFVTLLLWTCSFQCHFNSPRSTQLNIAAC